MSERERFEERFGPYYLDRCPDNPDKYDSGFRQGQWKAWQARADLAAERIAELEARERELVAALWHLHHNARTSGAEMGLALDAVEVVLAKIDAQKQEKGHE